MSRSFRFLILLILGLALLAAAGYFALVRTTRGWFERDVELRGQLAVQAANQGLTQSWSKDAGRLAGVLRDITRDERIMGAAACSTEGMRLVATEGFPEAFSCRDVVMRAQAGKAHEAGSWGTELMLPLGAVRVTVVRVEEGATLLGFVVLVHDLSFLERREAVFRNYLLIVFFVLAAGASAVTLLAARFSWRRWTLDLTKALSGEPTREFEPLMRDVRTLVDRLAEERRQDAQSGPWSAERLHGTLRGHLQGERIIVLANREPYIHQRSGNSIQVLHPASGLVTALEPVVRACSGVWVAHGSGSADRETVDARDRLPVPPGENEYWLRRVWLSEAQENGYYYGFSNEGLWPLCHISHVRPVFRADDWNHYVDVNRKFATAVYEEAESDDPIVLVQDYHFALAPRMIRERIPKATILTFWHIPWPNAEILSICPWREELLSGLLGSSILGFQTQQHCNNFLDAADAFLECRIDREDQAVVQGRRRTLVKSYPISIEWPIHRLSQVPPARECRSAVFTQLGLSADAMLGVGVDRLDYTKGIEERLAAVDKLLERYPEFRGRFTFVQLAAPSRTKIQQYKDLGDRVEQLVANINRRWGGDRYQPIVLLRAHHEPQDVLRYCRAADLCYVSSLHDGMNLVAKEFVAAREDLRGVLILSRFTGASRDLTEALVVNPYDLTEASDALAAALRMTPAEQRDRMMSMRKLVSEFNVYRWAGRMLVDAAEWRRKERLSERLNGLRLPLGGSSA